MYFMLKMFIFYIISISKALKLIEETE